MGSSQASSSPISNNWQSWFLLPSRNIFISWLPGHLSLGFLPTLLTSASQSPWLDPYHLAISCKAHPLVLLSVHLLGDSRSVVWNTTYVGTTLKRPVLTPHTPILYMHGPTGQPCLDMQEASQTPLSLENLPPLPALPITKRQRHAPSCSGQKPSHSAVLPPVHQHTDQFFQVCPASSPPLPPSSTLSFFLTWDEYGNFLTHFQLPYANSYRLLSTDFLKIQVISCHISTSNPPMAPHLTQSEIRSAH